MKRKGMILLICLATAVLPAGCLRGAKKEITDATFHEMYREYIETDSYQRADFLTRDEMTGDWLKQAEKDGYITNLYRNENGFYSFTLPSGILGSITVEPENDDFPLTN